MDATRISDGLLVRLKTVSTGSSEVRIASLLTSERLLRDPRNHCVPLLDHFSDSKDPSHTFLCMPWLHKCDQPPFETVGDVVNFVDQVLEVSLWSVIFSGCRKLLSCIQGLTFIHEQNVAHRYAHRCGHLLVCNLTVSSQRLRRSECRDGGRCLISFRLSSGHSFERSDWVGILPTLGPN